MDLHMRLLGARRERPPQKLLSLRQHALIFADQTQKLQPVRLVRICGQNLRQHRVGLLQAALPDEIRGLQNRCADGRPLLHGGTGL